jgi:GT2 family glycosyltransferase
MVSVLITTFNSARYLERCLASILQQSYPHLEIIVVDNASTDGTREVLRKHSRYVRQLLNDTNVGFAAGQNRAAASARGDWLLSLNPDVFLSRDFIANALALSNARADVGTTCGKLLRWAPESDKQFTNILDSTGIYFTRSLRHLDRGADEIDYGQFDRPQYVFGATGAAAFYRREMYEQIVARNGEFFDEMFFAYREDADLAWRSQLLGWKCVYVPNAVGWHVRRVTPERRGQLPLLINWHSVKNRFLMRAKNIGWRLYLRVLIPATLRDLQVIGYCFFADRRLISALKSVWNQRRTIWKKRQVIQAQRTVSDNALETWFRSSPASVPFPAADTEGETRFPPLPASISANSRSY